MSSLGIFSLLINTMIITSISNDYHVHFHQLKMMKIEIASKMPKNAGVGGDVLSISTLSEQKKTERETNKIQSYYN